MPLDHSVLALAVVLPVSQVLAYSMLVSVFPTSLDLFLPPTASLDLRMLFCVLHSSPVNICMIHTFSLMKLLAEVVFIYFMNWGDEDNIIQSRSTKIEKFLAHYSTQHKIVFSPSKFVYRR
ncbi:hypothetical protein BDR07DRAFT_1415935 [Suillus spraguei]|nr:hypothetical protein BDR07DRAFT_1415935 [Suillus spraguei]